MKRISTFQLYCILLMMTMPLAFLIVPKILTSYLENNAWLAPIAAVIPGTLIIYIPGWPRFYPSLFKSITNRIISSAKFRPGFAGRKTDPG